MSERLDRIEASIEELNKSLNFLVTEFIRPNAQQALANFERLERIESAVEANAKAIAENAKAIDGLTQLTELQNDQLENTRGIVADTAKGLAESKVQLKTLGNQVSEQSQQIQILIEEGRRDRQAQREALSGILNNANRIETLERKAG